MQMEHMWVRNIIKINIIFLQDRCDSLSRSNRGKRSVTSSNSTSSNTLPTEVASLSFRVQLAEDDQEDEIGNTPGRKFSFKNLNTYQLASLSVFVIICMLAGLLILVNFLLHDKQPEPNRQMWQ